jgi:hypothetical protein
MIFYLSIRLEAGFVKKTRLLCGGDGKADRNSSIKDSQAVSSYPAQR